MSIRKNVTLVAISVTLLVAASLILFARLSGARIEARVAEEVTAGRGLVWSQATAGLFEQMETGIPDFERDFALRQALKESDSNALRQAVDSITNLIGDQGYFDRLYLFNLAEVFLCCSDQDEAPPDVAALMQATIQDGKPHRSIGLNARGEPVALLAFALSVRRKPIGVALFQTQLTPALERFKSIGDSDVFLVGAEGQVFQATRPELFEPLGIEVPPLGEIDHQTLDLGEVVYTAAILPVQGLEGRPVAHLISIADYSEAYAVQHRFELVAYSSVALILILATIGLFWYMRHALRPLDDAVATVTALAEGDLGVSFATDRKDEVGQLMAALQTMVERIRGIIGQLHAASHDLHYSAGDMARLAETSKIQFDRQRSETSNVDLAVSQLASSAHEVATHTTRAVGVTTEARERIEGSRRIIEETTGIIELLATEIDQAADVVIGLADHGHAVGKVLEVIRNIASQTNLLALNAAIEAARAGQHGRGFAVVADEVRQLANRTHESIQEIEAMIGALRTSSTDAVGVIRANRDRAKESVDHYGQAVRNLDTFSDAVNRLTDMTHQIASAAEQQSRMAEEIAGAISQISQLAQEHAKAADSGFGHSARLSALSSTLKDQVDYFRLH